MLCVFDCESVPDIWLLNEIYGYRDEIDNEIKANGVNDINIDIEVCERAFQAQEALNGSSFLPLTFHKIISISALICDDFGNFIKIGNYAQSVESRGEREILSEFINYLNKNNPKLVSFNGRAFDLPLIMLRAMKYNISAESYFESDNPKFNKNKWDNYRSRYSENFHIDLLESLGSFGMARNMRLDVVAKMLGFPGKFDTKGDEVYKIFYEEKNLSKIDSYCQSDVLNTYLVFLKYQILQGKINTSDYISLLEVFLDKIPKNKDYSEVFTTAIKDELQKLKNY